MSAVQPSPRSTHSLAADHGAVTGQSPQTTTKFQPWRAVFPNVNPDPSQMRRYGFKKGEVMELAGNAGNFFAHDNWKIECESTATKIP